MVVSPTPPIDIGLLVFSNPHFFPCRVSIFLLISSCYSVVCSRVLLRLSGSDFFCLMYRVSGPVPVINKYPCRLFFKKWKGHIKRNFMFEKWVLYSFWRAGIKSCLEVRYYEIFHGGLKSILVPILHFCWKLSELFFPAIKQPRVWSSNLRYSLLVVMRIRDILVRIRILLFSSVTFKAL